MVDWLNWLNWLCVLGYFWLWFIRVVLQESALRSEGCAVGFEDELVNMLFSMVPDDAVSEETIYWMVRGSFYYRVGIYDELCI